MDAFDPASDPPYPCAPEDMPPTPRRVGLRRRSRLLRGTLLFGCLFGPVALLLWGYASGDTLRELTAEGQTASGRVTEKHRRSAGRGRRTYHVRYAFTAEGREQSGEVSVGADEYARLAEGKGCRVTYLPGRPEVHCLGDARERLGGKNEGVVHLALALSAGLAVGFGILEYRLRRELRLARFGEPVAARVTERGASHGDSRTEHWASYRFTSPEGDRQTGWNNLPKWVWDYLWPGTPVLVLRDPDRPHRHMPLYAFRHATIDLSAPAENGADDDWQSGDEE